MRGKKGGWGQILKNSWSDLVGFWSLVNLVRLGQIWSESVGFGQNLSDLVRVAPGRGPRIGRGNTEGI